MHRMHDAPPGEGFQVHMAGATVVVELSGDIDLQVRPRLVRQLDRLTGVPGPDLVIDLQAVTFLDCSGLSVLNRARLRTKQHGGRLRLVVDSPGILRVFRVTGLAPRFEIYNDAAAAL